VPTAREHLDALHAKVDAFFARAHERFPGGDGITCHAGCDDCCRRRFSVTAIEAEVIAELVATLPDATRDALAERALHGDAGVCAALDPDGRCAVYAARPVICRTHGLPIRFAAPDVPGKRALPVVDACPRNFAGRALDAIPADSVLDQATVSTVLGALDAARAAELGRPRGLERVEIAALLAAARGG
jgi:Fe-S-cluster containining protein